MKESKTKLNPTTNCLHSENVLSSQDICEIIKTCGESGVVDLEYGNLRISFQARNEPCQDELHYQSPGPVTAIPKVMEEDNLIRPDEMSVKEDELANMIIEDPLQYEALLANKELETGDD